MNGFFSKGHTYIKKLLVVHLNLNLTGHSMFSFAKSDKSKPLENVEVRVPLQRLGYSWPGMGHQGWYFSEALQVILWCSWGCRSLPCNVHFDLEPVLRTFSCKRPPPFQGILALSFSQADLRDQWTHRLGVKQEMLGSLDLSALP